MGWIDEEMRQDELDDAQEILYFRKHLSPEVSEKLSDADLQFILDSIAAYYAFSDVLDSQSNSTTDEVEVDGERIADYVVKACQDEGRAILLNENVLSVVALDMDYNESAEN